MTGVSPEQPLDSASTESRGPASVHVTDAELAEWEQVATEVDRLCRCDDDSMCACGAAAARDVIREAAIEVRSQAEQIERLTEEADRNANLAGSFELGMDESRAALAAEREKREVWETECAAANAAIARVEALPDEPLAALNPQFSAGYNEALRDVRAALSTQEGSDA